MQKAVHKGVRNTLCTTLCMPLKSLGFCVTERKSTLEDRWILFTECSSKFGAGVCDLPNAFSLCKAQSERICGASTNGAKIGEYIAVFNLCACNRDAHWLNKHTETSGNFSLSLGKSSQTGFCFTFWIFTELLHHLPGLLSRNEFRIFALL